MRNVFKGKNLTHLLYGILMLLPFCSILARVIYVQSNQNAKDSYYGDTINASETRYVSLPQLNTLTYLSPSTIITSSSGSFNKRFYYSYAELVGTSIDLSSGDSFRLYTNSQGNLEVLVYSGTTQIGDYYVTRDGYLFEFVLNDIADYTTQSTIDISNYTLFYYVTYNQYSFLDNVFDYSLNNFIESNNFNIDFFGWFNNLFLNQSGKNLVYLNFVNWYLNYALLVSAGYILFLLFLWFINFARKLLEGGNSFGHGGF